MSELLSLQVKVRLEAFVLKMVFKMDFSSSKRCLQGAEETLYLKAISKVIVSIFFLQAGDYINYRDSRINPLTGNYIWRPVIKRMGRQQYIQDAKGDLCLNLQKKKE